MRLHRFFSSRKIVEKVELGTQNEQSNLVALELATEQWRRVFRFGPGDRVVLFDGTGNDYVCEIKEFKAKNTHEDKETVLLRIIDIQKNFVKPKRNVSLCSAIVKKDMFEWIVEKSTELGVSDIIPVIAERSEKKNINVERLEKISIEASEQSGRGTIPNIHSALSFAKAVEEVVKKKQLTIAFDPSGIKFSDSNFFSKTKADNSIVVFIGPEGGWSPEELKIFESYGIPVMSLGPQILRAETAVVAAISQIIF